MKYSINGTCFQNEMSFKEYIHDDKFIKFVQDNITKTDVTVLSIVLTMNEDETYLDLIKQFSFDESQNLITNYKWSTSYDSKRYSGGNYSEPTENQIESLDYLKKLTTELNEVLSSININIVN